MGGSLGLCLVSSDEVVHRKYSSENWDDEDLVRSQELPLRAQEQLVYIDRDFARHGDNHSNRSTRASDSERSMRTNAKGMFVKHTSGVLSVPPSKLDRDKVSRFGDFLRDQGLDLSRWGAEGAKALDQLYWEAMEQRGCHILGRSSLDQPELMDSDGNRQVKRVVHLVKIRLVAEIFGVDHMLFSRIQFMHDGQQIERKQVPLRKLIWTIDPDDDQHGEDELKDESCQYVEDWRHAARKVLSERLGLSEQWQQMFLVEDTTQHTFHCEDNVKSSGYPGLNTLYCIHWVTLRVADPELQAAQCLGLPHGQEFATREGDFNFAAQGVDELGLPIGSQLNIWTWEREKRDDTAQASRPKPASPAASTTVSKATPAADVRFIKRVPLPTVSAQVLMDMMTRVKTSESDRPPSPILWSALRGLNTDWTRARRMARSMLDKSYTLANFNEDLAAFPEMHLYLLDHSNEHLFQDGGSSPSSSAASHAVMSSGRTLGDEYQRTVGCFYAVYWLLRLAVDGKEGFCFGVDENWTPYKLDAVNDEKLHLADKRILFHTEGKWDYFKRILVDANLISEDESGTVRLNEKRVVSLLALTAMHDIMKMDMILPNVQEEHAPFRGYAAGDRVGDHDHALSYLMEYYPELLPSFKGLDEEEQRAILFTQCKLQFNHGWFVQGEAPPGATFTPMKQALQRGDGYKIGSEDVALYFVHWLTDLSGAEPTPLGGCEKFVIKFPMMVLNSFLRSFEFVERIANETETQVVEEYLKMRWIENLPSPGPLPEGDGAVAKMRLLCMAQMNAGLVLRGFDELQQDDREVLCREMSLTGCEGQSFSSGICPKEVRDNLYGPAFLIYYGPAFLQNLGSDLAVVKVGILAEIYRRARVLWPAQADQVSKNVTVRIDTIKGISVTDLSKALQAGDVWLMVKHNESEAFIERSSQRKLNRFISSRQPVQILDIARAIDHKGSALFS